MKYLTSEITQGCKHEVLLNEKNLRFSENICDQHIILMRNTKKLDRGQINSSFREIFHTDFKHKSMESFQEQDILDERFDVRISSHRAALYLVQENQKLKTENQNLKLQVLFFLTHSCSVFAQFVS